MQERSGTFAKLGDLRSGPDSRTQGYPACTCLERMAWKVSSLGTSMRGLP